MAVTARTVCNKQKTLVGLLSKFWSQQQADQYLEQAYVCAWLCQFYQPKHAVQWVVESPACMPQSSHRLQLQHGWSLGYPWEEGALFLFPKIHLLAAMQEGLWVCQIATIPCQQQCIPQNVSCWVLWVTGREVFKLSLLPWKRGSSPACPMTVFQHPTLLPRAGEPGVHKLQLERSLLVTTQSSVSHQLHKCCLSDLG